VDIIHMSHSSKIKSCRFNSDDKGEIQEKTEAAHQHCDPTDRHGGSMSDIGSPVQSKESEQSIGLDGRDLHDTKGAVGNHKCRKEHSNDDQLRPGYDDGQDDISFDIGDDDDEIDRCGDLVQRLDLVYLRDWRGGAGTRKPVSASDGSGRITQRRKAVFDVRPLSMLWRASPISIDKFIGRAEEQLGDSLIGVSAAFEQRFVAPLGEILKIVSSFLDHKSDLPQPIKSWLHSKVEEALPHFPCSTHNTKTVIESDVKRMYLMSLDSMYLHSFYLWGLVESTTPIISLQCWVVDIRT
jgi:hypothetical protein